MPYKERQTGNVPKQPPARARLFGREQLRRQHFVVPRYQKAYLRNKVRCEEPSILQYHIVIILCTVRNATTVTALPSAMSSSRRY